MKSRKMIWLLVLAALAGCVNEPGERAAMQSAEDAASVVFGRFSTRADAGFFDAPFPNETMRRADGTVRWDRLPDRGNPVVRHYKQLANTKTRGFSCLGAIDFPFTGDIDAANLPINSVESLAEGAPVLIVNVDPKSPTHGTRIPLRAKWYGASTLYVPAKTLALLPFQGAPLEEGTLYAAVVLRSLGDARGHPLGSPKAIVDMREGRVPDGENGAALAASFQPLWEWCRDSGFDADEIATATVFRTGRFTDEMRALRNAVAEQDAPTAHDWRLLAEYNDYYLIEGRTALTIWQDGERPYWTGGGEIHFENGVPIPQWTEDVRFSVSVPKSVMPAGGYPLLFYGNGQGGSYTQVFDRTESQHDASPGYGPGALLARRGIAALDIEAPTVGPRHPTGSDSGIEFFNFWNLVAFRDNVRQAASEFTALVALARDLRVPAELTPSADTGSEGARYDADQFYFWGQSTGASIGELVLAAEPGIRAGVLSGAGVSWIYNVTYKQEPIPFRLLFQALTLDFEADEFHPIATLFQNVNDPAEAAYFGRRWLREPFDDAHSPDVLLIMGVFDGYFPPPMVDGLTAAAGLDVAEPPAWNGTADALALSGRDFVSLPVTGNVDTEAGARLGLTLSYQQPLGVDGHYVAFVRPDAQYQWSCFFQSIARTGVASVPLPLDDRDAPCPAP